MSTRIAPTPSGYLHLGNCVNFLLTAWLARDLGIDVSLRIDDIDADRYRVAYVDDVFRILDWLSIDLDGGPRSTSEFESHYSLRARTEYYLDEVRRATWSGVQTYACRCSRAQLRARGSLRCVSACRADGVEWEPGSSALRVHVPDGTTIDVGGTTVDLAAALGDFVLVRRDGQPSYQLASLIEDRDAGTTHLVRGADLLPSSAAQLLLAPAFDAESFGRITFVHHDLIADASGAKLSKSQLDAGPLDTSDDQRRRVHDLAAGLAESLGISPR